MTTDIQILIINTDEAYRKATDAAVKADLYRKLKSLIDFRDSKKKLASDNTGSNNNRQKVTVESQVTYTS
jgi:hypothetical protein